MEHKVSKYTHRFLARFVIELETPLALSSGTKDIISDSLVAVDVNGLPYLPGTSIAGVVRSILDAKKSSRLFGFQTKNDSKGSEIIFSEGKILNSKGDVIDGLMNDGESDELINEYYQLPIRQHASISCKGRNTAKFDEQVVYAGTRFCFEIEIVSDGSNFEDMQNVLSTIGSQNFRIGGGTRNGFGKIKIISCNVRKLDLRNEEDRKLYLSKSSKLSKSWEGWSDNTKQSIDKKVTEGWIEYSLTIRPDDFYYFGSGFGDVEGNVDNTTVRASKVIWNNGHGKLATNCALIPATSFKGALRHRVAYHYNKLTENFATPSTVKDDATDNNEAVKSIFGYINGKDLKCGNAIFADIIKQSPKLKRKTFNHVKIDRITCAPIDGALFTDQADYALGDDYQTTIYVKRSAMKDANIRKAFESALSDVCNGLLPLGGSVNRGYGIFTGTYTINEA